MTQSTPSLRRTSIGYEEARRRQSLGVEEVLLKSLGPNLAAERLTQAGPGFKIRREPLGPRWRTEVRQPG
nr:hypothetical protein CFP56_09987 [Quercus suber]